MRQWLNIHTDAWQQELKDDAGVTSRPARDIKLTTIDASKISLNGTHAIHDSGNNGKVNVSDYTTVTQIWAMSFMKQYDALVRDVNAGYVIECSRSFKIAVGNNSR